MLTGTIFDDFKVIKLSYITKNHVKVYLCECVVCGKQKEIQLSRLKNGITTRHSNKHCGNYIKEYDEYMGLCVDDHKIINFLRSDKGNLIYLAECVICGTTFETIIHNFIRGYGTRHKSCTHHLPKDKHLKRFRKIYSCMIQRTTNENYSEFNLYGGRGINSIEFEDFIFFYKTMFKSYVEHCKKHGEKNTSIDRIDVNGNYTVKNCRWATPKEQANNKRCTK